MSGFKKLHSFDKRQAESEPILRKYSDRIPIICDRADRSNIHRIDKTKYLVPADLTVGQFVFVIRKRINLGHEKALFLFINDELAPTSYPLSLAYDQKKDDDGFLYITYSGENTFGASASDLPCEVWAEIVERLTPLPRLCFALTCKAMLDFVDRHGHLRASAQFHRIRENRNVERRAVGKFPRWQTLTCTRWSLLEGLEDDRWKCCSGCLQLHPPRKFSDGELAKPPKERYCQLGGFNGFVSLCQCLDLSYRDKLDLLARLQRSGGQWEGNQPWHKCSKNYPVMGTDTGETYGFHVQMRPRLGEQDHLFIEATYKLTARPPNSSRWSSKHLLCPHRHMWAFEPHRAVPSHLCHHFGTIHDATEAGTQNMPPRWFSDCNFCKSTVIDYGQVETETSATHYLRTVRDLGGPLVRPDKAWFRQTSTSDEALEYDYRLDRSEHPGCLFKKCGTEDNIVP